jgi:hypothetical protein
MSLIVLCHHQAAARFLVQSMNNARALLSTHAGKIRAMMEEGVDQSMLAMARARVNHQPGRFVDYDQIVVFKKNIERDRLWLIIGFFRQWLGYANSIARPDPITLASSLAIQADETIPDQLLQT